MSRRRSTISLLVSQLDSRVKEKILNLNVDKEKLKKFDETEGKEIVAQLTDLRDIENKSESEVLKTLNLMFKNKQ
jgi:hypothetical protein